MKSEEQYNEKLERFSLAIAPGVLAMFGYDVDAPTTSEFSNYVINYAADLIEALEDDAS